MIDLTKGTPLYNRVATCSERQFPEATWDNMVAKCCEEGQEVLNAVKSKRLLEFADMQICLWSALHKDGWTHDDLQSAIKFKTAVNERRKWSRRSDGTYQHVEEE